MKCDVHKCITIVFTNRNTNPYPRSCSRIAQTICTTTRQNSPIVIGLLFSPKLQTQSSPRPVPSIFFQTIGFVVPSEIVASNFSILSNAVRFSIRKSFHIESVINLFLSDTGCYFITVDIQFCWLYPLIVYVRRLFTTVKI